MNTVTEIVMALDDWEEKYSAVTINEPSDLRAASLQALTGIAKEFGTDDVDRVITWRIEDAPFRKQTILELVWEHFYFS
jgi:hypothetical protein